MPAAEKILRRMPEPLAGILRRTEKPLLEKVTEIRLRAGEPLALSVGEQAVFLSPQGRQVPPEQGYTVKQELVQETMIALSGHSLHGIEKTLEQGYFTAPGGFRVGVCLEPYAAKQGQALSLNIRIPREMVGAAEDYFPVWKGCRGLILAGPPASGKTTVLRDLCRLISAGKDGEPCSRTVLVDERSELSGWDGEQSLFHLGPATDIISGIPKEQAILQAMRTLSPQVILCDEVAGEREADAIRYAFFCGVRFAVTVHCGSRREVSSNRILRELMSSGAFSHIILLGLPPGSGEGTVITYDEYYREAFGLRPDPVQLYGDRIQLCRNNPTQP